MKSIARVIIAIISVFISAQAVLAAGSRLDDLVKKKTKELLAGYRGAKDLSIAIVDTDTTPVSKKITTVIYQAVFDDRRFSIVERELLTNITKELELQHTGLVKIAADVGKMTGANLILLIRKEDTDMRLRIVSVDKGVIMAYSYIPLEDIATAESGGRTGQDRPVFGTQYHSPVLAGLVSVFPVWSGSWNAGWTEWGMALVVGKTGSWIPVVVFWFQYANEKKQYDDFNKKMRSYYYSSTTSITLPTLSLALIWGDRYKRQMTHAEDRYKKSLVYCSIAWAGVTLIDIITSTWYVISRNPQYGSGLMNGESPGIACSVSSRLNYRARDSIIYAVPDGMDFRISYRF
jgi:hypothetical protein